MGDWRIWALFVVAVFGSGLICGYAVWLYTRRHGESGRIKLGGKVDTDGVEFAAEVTIEGAAGALALTATPVDVAGKRAGVPMRATVPLEVQS
jgi:hypothetical protein